MLADADIWIAPTLVTDLTEQPEPLLYAKLAADQLGPVVKLRPNAKRPTYMLNVGWLVEHDELPEDWQEQLAARVFDILAKRHKLRIQPRNSEFRAPEGGETMTDVTTASAARLQRALTKESRHEAKDR